MAPSLSLLLLPPLVELLLPPNLDDSQSANGSILAFIPAILGFRYSVAQCRKSSTLLMTNARDAMCTAATNPTHAAAEP
jgi:hypothetical protein